MLRVTLVFALFSVVSCNVVVKRQVGLEAMVMEQANTINQLKAQVTDLANTVNNELPKLQALVDQQTKMVAFHVDFDNYTSNNYNISDGGIIAFDNIELNEGNGYDNYTGYFTAPIGGLYSFSVRYEMVAATYMFVSLMTAEGYQAFGVVGDTVWQSGGGLSSLLKLDKGDTVWVERYSGTVGWLLSGHRSSFSGFLVHAEDY